MSSRDVLAVPRATGRGPLDTTTRPGAITVYAGILCRLRGYRKDERRKALADSTLFLQARKLGLTLVSANVEEFELLQQVQPEGQVLFYEAA